MHIQNTVSQNTVCTETLNLCNLDIQELEAYSEPYKISIMERFFRALCKPGIFRTLLCSEPEEYSESCQAYMMQRFLNESRHIQNPSISRTLAYFETVVYSEPCQIYTMKNFIQNPLQLQHICTPDKFKTLVKLKTFQIPWIMMRESLKYNLH